MYRFSRRYNFGSVEYKIDNEDKTKPQEYRDIDYEYLRLIALERDKHKAYISWSIFLFLGCLTLLILNGIALSQEAYTTVFGINMAITFEVILGLLTFVFMCWMGYCFDDCEDLSKLEDLYCITEAGQSQYREKMIAWELKEKEKNDFKAEQLITTYDTLDSDLKREKKIEIISEIIKNMENK